MLNQTEQVALDNFKSMGTMNREQVAEYFKLLKKLEVEEEEDKDLVVVEKLDTKKKGRAFKV